MKSLQFLFKIETMGLQVFIQPDLKRKVIAVIQIIQSASGI